MSDQNQLSDVDLVTLDYDGKVKLLERVITELLRERVEYAEISARYAEKRANIKIYELVKSGLQSAIKAEGQIAGTVGVTPKYERING